MSKKNIILIVIFSFGFVLLLADIYLRFKSGVSESTNQISNTNPTPIPTSIISPTITTKPTSANTNYLTETDNKNIQIIRTYYAYLSQHKLKEAYDMYQSKSTTFDKFTEWYKDIISIEPSNFNKISENTYKFDINLVEKPSYSETSQGSQFWVTMKVSSKKVNTISSIQVISEDYYGDMHAYAILKNSKNYLIISKNGKETIIDSRDDDYTKNFETSGGFDNLHFSPQGNYLIYGFVGWEYYGGRVYDIKNKQILKNVVSDYPQLFKISQNEKYIVNCAGSEIGGGYEAAVYSFPEFKPQFDFLKYSKYDMLRKCLYNDGREENFMCDTYACELNEKNNIVKFSLHSQENIRPEDYKRVVVEYDLNQGKLIQ